MRPEPGNDLQEWLADKVDKKAKAIADGLGRWVPSEMTAKMSIVTPEEGTAEDDAFLKAYVEWRSRNPVDF